MNRTAILLIFSVMVLGCSAHQKKQVTFAEKIEALHDTTKSHDYFSLGSQAFESWMTKKYNEKRQLLLAINFLEKAAKKHPNNVVYQASYYNAIATYAFTNIDFDEQTLLRQFESLHPEILPNAIAPALVAFQRAKQSEKPLSEQVKHLKRAVSQNPYNPQHWYFLAQIYLARQQFWLAYTASAHALNIVPESSEYQFQGASILLNFAYSKACVVDEHELLKLALPLANAAAAANKRYTFLAARMYSLLGINPLFYQLAQQAYRESPVAINTRLLVDAAISTNNIKALERAVKAVDVNGSNANARELSLWAAFRQDWDNAARYYSHYIKKRSPDFYQIAIARWLYEISDLNISDIQLPELTPSNAWEKQLLDTIEDTPPHPNKLLNTALNSCHRIDVNFFNAYRFWKAKDYKKSIDLLNKVIQQKTLISDEQLFARYLKQKISGKI